MNTEIKKKRTDLTQSYDKAPIPTENYEIASSNFDYTMIVNWLGTTRWSDYSHLTGVVKPVNVRPTFPLTAKAV